MCDVGAAGAMNPSPWAKVSVESRMASIRNVPRLMTRELVASLAVLLALPIGGEAQGGGVRRCVSDTTGVVSTPQRLLTVDTIAPGITYTCLMRPEGPWLLHVATVELKDRRYIVDGVRAMDRMVG